MARGKLGAACLAVTLGCGGTGLRPADAGPPDAGPADASPADAPPGSGAIMGPIVGMTVAVADSFAGCGLLAGGHTRRVVLFSRPAACAVFTEAFPTDGQYLQIDLAHFDQGFEQPTAIGTYTVIPDDPNEPGDYAAA
jgi:hypothetical protein